MEYCQHSNGRTRCSRYKKTVQLVVVFSFLQNFFGYSENGNFVSLVLSVGFHPEKSFLIFLTCLVLW